MRARDLVANSSVGAVREPPSARALSDAWTRLPAPLQRAAHAQAAVGQAHGAFAALATETAARAEATLTEVKAFVEELKAQAGMPPRTARPHRRSTHELNRL